MIDFRYHLVSIVAIFLALAVGVVLGTTMLQDPLLNTLEAETADLREQSEELRVEKDIVDQLNAGGDEMVAAYADDMLEERLDGVRVVVLESPGADEEMRDEIVARIEQAGGTVPGRLAFAEKYVDTDQAALVSEVTEEFAGGVELPDGNPYERAGAQIAHAVLGSSPRQDGTDGGGSGDEESAAVDPETVIAGFAERELLAVHGKPDEGADIGLVLGPAVAFAGGEGPSPGAEDNTPPPGNGVMLALSRALHATQGGAVLAGPPSSLGAGGIVAQARHEEARYSTVDVAGRTTGNVVTALVVAAAAEERFGSFGIGEGVNGFLPEPLPEAARDDGDEE